MSAQPRSSMFRPHQYSTNTQNSSSTLSNNPANSALQSRISAKRAELQNLQALRDLSAALATQMAELEAKLATLRDGAEAVAVVLGNWDNVLGAIRLASSKAPALLLSDIPIDQEQSPEDQNGVDQIQPKATLPVTLVRIPVATDKLSEGKDDGSD